MNALDRNLAWASKLQPGWHPLFRHLVLELAALDPTLRIWQAKQKLGELRVYLNRHNACARALIQAAEIEAKTSCESCGAPAELTRSQRGYYATLCEDHRGDAVKAKSPIIARFWYFPPPKE